MDELIFIWVIAFCNWLNAGTPSAKSIFSAKINESPMNNVRSEGIGGA